MSVLGFYRILHDGLTCQNQLVGGQASLSVIKVTRTHVFSDSNTEIHHQQQMLQKLEAPQIKGHSKTL